MPQGDNFEFTTSVDWPQNWGLAYKNQILSLIERKEMRWVLKKKEEIPQYLKDNQKVQKILEILAGDRNRHEQAHFFF